MTSSILKKLILIISISLFGISLTPKSYCVNNECGDSFATLILGFFAPMLCLAGITWFANPLIIVSWVQFIKDPKKSIFTSLASIILALSFLFFPTIVKDEAGHVGAITGYKAGYWLWCSSSAVMLVGGFYFKVRRAYNG